MENKMRKSLRLLQVEKMVIILKELEHIKNILNFFNGYKEDSEKEQKPIKRNISYLKNDIVALEKQIEKLKDINNSLKNTTPMLFVVQYDYIRTQIEDMLRVIQALYNKMQQLFGETLNQYLPYPILGRRYSNNGIMMYLGNYYRESLKIFSPKHTNKLILGWNYRTSFQYRIFVNRELKRENYEENTYNDYIDLPYWYYELPFLLPSITHEVAFIALRKPDKKLLKPYKNLKKRLKKLFDDPKNNFIQKVQDIIGYEEYSNDLAKVIFCDIVGYQIHKEAYIQALFHNILGEKLSHDYLKIIHHSKEEEIEIVPSEWHFLQKKDHSILRLHFLLSVYKDDKNNQEYKNMIELLNAIMPLDKSNSTHQGFDQVYRNNYPNLRASYQSVQNYLSQLLTVLNDWETKNQNLIKKIKSVDKKKSPNFSNLWEQRFKTLKLEEDTVTHQNNFRREIHHKASNISFLDNEKSESIIYLMELGKARKDIPTNSIDVNKKLQNEITKDHKDSDIEKLAIYGIYDWFTLKKKETTIKISDQLNYFLDKTRKENYDLRYFKTKQILMKVNNTIYGNVKQSYSEKFSVIFNIELLKKIDNDTCTNGYNDLNDAITTIAQELNKQKNNFKDVNIYKSLGPKDLTLIVREISLHFLFQLLEKLNDKDIHSQIMRTFTMICSDFDVSPDIEKDFSLISYLRVSNNFTQKNISKLIDSNMESLNHITGVMDYRATWKEDTTISHILNYYNNMIEKSYLTDFQTKIEQKIDINHQSL